MRFKANQERFATLHSRMARTNSCSPIRWGAPTQKITALEHAAPTVAKVVVMAEVVAVMEADLDPVNPVDLGHRNHLRRSPAHKR
jgi:hypothetical protein